MSFANLTPNIQPVAPSQIPQQSQPVQPSPAPQVPAGNAPAPTPQQMGAPAPAPRLPGSVLDLFSTQPQLQQNHVQYMQNTPGMQAVQPQPQTPPQEPESPLAQFAKLFETSKEGSQAPAQVQLDAPLFAMDATKLRESVSKQNFVGQIDPQLQARALQGDAQALSQLLNAQAQNVFVHAAMLTQNMVEQGINTYNARLQGVLPTTFKSLATQDALAAATPAAGHAAVQPLLQSLQSQILAANPNMPPHEVAQQLRNYLQAVGAALAPQQAPQVTPVNPVTGQPLMQPAAQQSQDWAQYFA
jgi:hypothetical protein